MNLLIVSPLFPPEIGGPSTYIVPLAKGLASKGHSVKVVALATEHPAEKFGLDVFSVLHGDAMPVRETRLLKSILSLGRGSDVIYALDVAAIGMQCVLAGKILGKPVVVRYAGDTAWEKARRQGKSAKGIEEFLREPDANHWIVDLEKFVLGSAAAVITPSRYLKRVLMECMGTGGGKIFAINNAIEEVVPAGGRKRRAIAYGRFVPWKHFGGVIEAFAGLPEENLVIVGEGPLKDELEGMASGKQNVSILGKMPHKELMAALSGSEMFVLNSSYEGMAHSILEAFAAGTPVIASDIEPNRELITDGENGLLVPLEPREKNVEGIRKAVERLRDKGFATKIAGNAQSKLKEHSWGEVLKETESVLANAGKKPAH